MARHKATLYNFDLNSLPDESLHHTLQQLHHLLYQPQAPVAAFIQSISFALVHIDNEAFLPVRWSASMRSHTLTTPDTPTGFSATIPDGLAAFLEAILLMAFVIISKVLGSLGPSTGLSSDRSSGFQWTSTVIICS